MKKYDDLFGTAFLEFHAQGIDHPIQVWINGEEQDPLPPSYFFRSYEEMPEIEQLALAACGDRVLDVGAAAGCHSLWLKANGHRVRSIELSPLACDVMRQRGLTDVVCADFLAMEPVPEFDTVLFLMNGLGMGKDVEGTARLLRHAARFLHADGQIIGDSSDIAYLYDDDETKRELSSQPPFDHYYGKVHFELKWKNLISEFPWIYPDPAVLRQLASLEGLDFTVVAEGPHHDYLCAFRNQR